MTSWDLGGGGIPSFQFEKLNDKVIGKVIDLAEQQQTDAKTRELKFWDPEKTRPVMMYAVTLQTDLRDPRNPDDDGKRMVYLSGSAKPEKRSKLSAVLEAVKAKTGGTQLQYGATVGLAWIDNRPAEVGTAKCYAAMYEPPAVNLDQPPEHRGVAQPPVAPPENQAAQAWGQSPGPGPQWAQQEAPDGRWGPGGDPWAQSQPAQPNSPAQQSQQAAQDPWGTQQAPPATPNPWGPQAGAQGPPSGQQADPWGSSPQGQQGQFTEQVPPGAFSQTQQQGQADPWGNPPAGPGASPGQNAPSATAQGQPQGQQGEPITREQIAGLHAINIDPATVYGPDWRQRVQQP